MGILWDSYGISLWFLCYFHVISKIFLWDFCRVPMGLLRDLKRISIAFLEGFFGNSMGFP